MGNGRSTRLAHNANPSKIKVFERNCEKLLFFRLILHKKMYPVRAVALKSFCE